MKANLFVRTILVTIAAVNSTFGASVKFDANTLTNSPGASFTVGSGNLGVTSGTVSGTDGTVITITSSGTVLSNLWAGVLAAAGSTTGTNIPTLGIMDSTANGAVKGNAGELMTVSFSNWVAVSEFVFTSLGRNDDNLIISGITTDPGTVSFSTLGPVGVSILDYTYDASGARLIIDFLPFTLSDNNAFANAVRVTLGNAVILKAFSFSADQSGTSAGGAGISSVGYEPVVLTNPPSIAAFIASPSAILSDRPVALQWNALFADHVEINQGIGTVNSFGSQFLTVTNSSLPLTFTLTATNAIGSTNVSVTFSNRSVTEPVALLACWPFDGNFTEDIMGWSAVQTNDGSGLEYLTFASDVPPAIATRRTNSLDFGGSNFDGYVQTGFGGFPGTMPRSISFWIKLDAVTGFGRSVFSYGSEANGAGQSMNLFSGDALAILFRGNAGTVATPGPIPEFGWVHVAYIYSGTSGSIFENVAIYINGTNVHFGTTLTQGSPVNTAQSPLQFGRDQLQASHNYPSSMKLSECAFFKGELTPAQVAALAGGADPKLLDGVNPTPVVPALAQQFTQVTADTNVPPAQLALTWQATLGTFHDLLSSTNLVDWETNVVSLPSAGTGNVRSVTLITNETQRFFRLRQN